MAGALDFLKKIKIEEVKAVKKEVRVSKKHPSEEEGKTVDIRVYKNGATYPSPQLVALCDLEYKVRALPKAKVDATEVQEAVVKEPVFMGFGFDIFKSTEFPNTANSDVNCVFIASVPKDFPKVDLFGRTTYKDEDKITPVSSVLEQGTVTGGLKLLELIKEMYGVEVNEKLQFIDLVIVRDQPFTTPNGLYNIPKTVSRGEDAGKLTYELRKDLTIYALVPKQFFDDTVEEQVPVEIDSTTTTKFVTLDSLDADDEDIFTNEEIDAKMNVKGESIEVIDTPFLPKELEQNSDGSPQEEEVEFIDFDNLVTEE